MQVFGGTVGRAWRAVATGGDTPTRLRTWMVGSVVAVLFGVLGAVGVGRRDSALGAGDAASQQLIAVQDVQVRLVHADSIARENYLRGGIEDAAKRATYETELAAVSDGLVAVGNRVLPDDAAMLAAVSAQLTHYSGLIEQARANNRQGFPVGAAYLRTANDLATTMVAGLRDVQSSLRSQVNDNLDGADTAGLWLHLTGWPLLVLLLTGGGWVAFRFRRLLNVPLAVAAGVTLLLLVIGGSMQGRVRSACAGIEHAHRPRQRWPRRGLAGLRRHGGLGARADVHHHGRLHARRHVRLVRRSSRRGACERRRGRLGWGASRQPRR